MIGNMDTLTKHSTVLGLAVISLLALSSSAAQAKITKLLKKRKIVVINDKRVKKGDQVCFYEKKNKRACGRVVKVSKKRKRSYVRIKKRSSFRKLEKGMAHEVVGAGGIARRSSGASLFKLRASFQPSFNRRARYTLANINETDTEATFSDAAEPKAGDTIWAKGHDFFANQAWGGAGLEFESSVYGNMSAAAGGRYVYLASATSSGNPGTSLHTDSESTTGVKASEHEISAWLDFYPYEIPTAMIRLGLGVEGNYNMLSISGDILSCKNKACAGTSAPKAIENIYKASTNVVTLSFRATVRRDFKIADNIGIGTSLRGIVTPVDIIKSVDTLKATKLEPKVKTLFKDQANFEKKLRDALGYGSKKANHFSIMAEISAFFSF